MVLHAFEFDTVHPPRISLSCLCVRDQIDLCLNVFPPIILLILPLSCHLYVSEKRDYHSSIKMSLSDHFYVQNIGDQSFFFPQQRQNQQTLHEVMWAKKVRTKEIMRRIPIPVGLFLKIFLNPSRQFCMGGPSQSFLKQKKRPGSQIPLQLKASSADLANVSMFSLILLSELVEYQLTCKQHCQKLSYPPVVETTKPDDDDDVL